MYVDMFKGMCLDFIASEFGVEEDTALSLMQHIVYESPENLVDFALYMKISIAIIENAQNTGNLNLFLSVCEEIKDFVCERAKKRMNSAYSEDEGDILSQLRSMGFTFEDDTNITEPMTMDAMNKVIEASNVVQNNITRTAFVNLTEIHSRIVSGGIKNVMVDMGIDSSSHIYIKIYDEFMDLVKREKLNERDANMVFLGFMFHAFVDAIENGVPCDEYIQKIRGDQVLRYLKTSVVNTWRKSAAIGIVMNILNNLLADGAEISNPTNHEVVELVGTLAKAFTKLRPILPMNAENRQGLEKIYRLIATV